MKTYYVIGTGFGDEGKGATVDWLASKDNPVTTLVRRFSGGGQAGHTVVVGDNRHVFSNWGSGTLRGCDTFWSKDCPFDLRASIVEKQALRKLSVRDTYLYVDLRCQVITPIDIFINQLESKTNTVGVGIGTTITRNENHYRLEVADLLCKSVFKYKFDLIFDYYKNVKGYDLKASINEGRNSRLEIAIEEFKDSVHNIDKLCKEYNIEFVDSSWYTDYNLRRHKYQTLINEGSQGLLLDPRLGYFPYVTRTNLIPDNLDNSEVYLVSRCYLTRHGAGPFPSLEGFDLDLINNSLETNVLNTFQGNFVKGPLNLKLLNNTIYRFLNYSNYFNNRTKLNVVITCLDQFRTDHIPVLKDTNLNSNISFVKIDEIIESIDSLRYDGVYFDNFYITKGPKSNDNYKIII